MECFLSIATTTGTFSDDDGMRRKRNAALLHEVGEYPSIPIYTHLYRQHIGW